MALHKNFPKDKFAILEPDIRWFPADLPVRCTQTGEALREQGYEKVLAPFVPELRKRIKEWRDKGYDEAVVVSPVKSKEPDKPYDISKIDFNRLRAEFDTAKTRNTAVQSLKSVIEKKLQRLIQRNPLRTNFQEHYEKIIAEYNKEKDRQNIEATFEALLKFVQELDEEESRAVREGLDEETLAMYDLLLKPDLTAKEIKKIKKVAKELLKTLKDTLMNLYKWQDKEPTRDEVKVLIRNFLWDEKTGLPVDFYTQDDVKRKSEEVFYHVYRAYPTVPSPYYAAVAN